MRTDERADRQTWLCSHFSQFCEGAWKLQFCLYVVFVCFLRFSWQTAIIYLYGINQLVLITEAKCVYCAVQTESLKCNWGSILSLKGLKITITISDSYTGLFQMIVGVLTTCHTQYTWDSSIYFFLFNRTILQVFVTYLTGALYVHPLWFYKHQHDNRVRSKLFVACQRW